MKWLKTKILQLSLRVIFKYIRVHPHSSMEINTGNEIIELKISVSKEVNVYDVWETIMTEGIK